MKMKPTIEKVFWKEARKEIGKVGERFVDAVDNVDSSKELYLWRVTYPYGAKIIDDGLLYLPNSKGNLISLKDKNLPPEIRNDLDYTSNIPIGIIADKAIESYFVKGDSFIPCRIMSAGRTVSLWASLQPLGTSCNAGGIWQLTSGAHSIFMLPKASENLKYKKLQKAFGLKSDPPKKMMNQFDVYKEMANHPDFPTEWECVIYFLPREWKESVENENPAWESLLKHFLKCLFKDTMGIRDNFVFDFALSMGLEKTNQKPNPYLFDTFKHICSVVRGISPAFKIATNDAVAPISGIQDSFDKIYGIPFDPTIVHLANLNEVSAGEGLYYSLEVPTMLSFSPKARILENKLEDLREIKRIATRLQAYIKKDELMLKDTPIYKLAEGVSFEYYHATEDAYGDINNSLLLPTVERALMESKNKKPFCHTSSFLRGCIRILVNPS